MKLSTSIKIMFRKYGNDGDDNGYDNNGDDGDDGGYNDGDDDSDNCDYGDEDLMVIITFLHNNNNKW